MDNTDNKDNNDIIEPFIGSMGIFDLGNIFSNMEGIIQQAMSLGMFSFCSFCSCFCCIIFIIMAIMVAEKIKGSAPGSYLQ